MVGDPTELWKQIGKTLWHVQMAEFSLVNFFVASRLHKTPLHIDTDDLLERNFKATVGVIVGNLRQAGMLSEATDSALAKFVSERNWLAHHIRRLNSSDIYNQEKYSALLTRLEELKRNSEEISLGVVVWIHGWAQSRGMTADEIEQETRKQLAKLRGET